MAMPAPAASSAGVDESRSAYARGVAPQSAVRSAKQQAERTDRRARIGAPTVPSASHPAASLGADRDLEVFVPVVPLRCDVVRPAADGAILDVVLLFACTRIGPGVDELA